jgi:hypothetical protein
VLVNAETHLNGAQILLALGMWSGAIVLICLAVIIWSYRRR